MAFDALVTDLVGLSRDLAPDCVACIDALGFILGTAIARELGVGVVPVRKGGKLPVEAHRESFIDYSGSEKSLEMRHDAIQRDSRVLLVDDWVETGAQAAAAIRLIEQLDGVVVGVSTIHMDRNADTETIRKNYRVLAASELQRDGGPS